MSSTNPSSSPWEPPVPEDMQRMLPQYEITGLLGRGGMGAVYRRTLLGLGSDGVPLACGSNSAGQASIPENFNNSIVKVGASNHSSTSWLIRHEGKVTDLCHLWL